MRVQGSLWTSGWSGGFGPQGLTCPGASNRGDLGPWWEGVVAVTGQTKCQRPATAGIHVAYVSVVTYLYEYVVFT